MCGKRHRALCGFALCKFVTCLFERTRVCGQVGRRDGDLDALSGLRHECFIACEPDGNRYKGVFCFGNHLANTKMGKNAGADPFAMTQTVERYHRHTHVQRG